MNQHPIQSEEGGRVEMLLAAPCYRNKRDITTVLKHFLTRMETPSCEIAICIKIPHLQYRQPFCLNNKYIKEKGNCLSLTHQH